MWFVDSLTDVATRVRNAFNAELSGIDAWIARNNIAPTAKVIGGAHWEVLGRQAFIARQMFVLTAEGPYLDKHGEQFGLPRKAASLAGGNVVVTSPDAIDVPAGTQFTLGNSGVAYQSSADASLSAAGSLTIAVVALAAGSNGNGLANAPLTISNGTGAGLSGPGASGAMAVIGPKAIVGGLDDEIDDDYRARILFRMRNPPSGGSASDYVIWASQVPGVTRVFVERRWRGAGTIRVFPLFDNLFPGGIAPQSYADSVADYLDPLQPGVAIVTVVSPQPSPINVTIKNLSPANTSTQNAVTAELTDTMRRLGRVSGSDRLIGGMPYLASSFTFAQLWAAAAISNAAGVISADMQTPSADQPVPSGYIPVLGNIQLA